MGKPVTHWEINARDAAKLKTFYSELFDWKIDDNNPTKYGVVETGGKGINGGIGRGQDFFGVTFYVEVEDLEEYLTKARTLGGRTLMPPTVLPQVTLAVFADPEGNRIGLVKSGSM